MTNNLKEKLIDKSNSGTKQERIMCKLLLNDSDEKIKNLEGFSERLGCSNSSVTRFARSLGYPSFPHFYYEYSEKKTEEKLTHINNDIMWYSKVAKEISDLIQGHIYIFSSRRGKSIAKFLSERLNTVDIFNEYYHESWGRSIQDQIKKIKKNDTPILFTMNAQSNVAKNYLEELVNAPNVKNIIVLTANMKFRKHEKIHHFSLSQIDNMNYAVETFDGYNFASSRMIGLTVALMKEIYSKQNK